MESHVLGDWGTSRLRLYRMSAGEVTGRLDGPGIGALNAPAQTVLADRLNVWLAEGAIGDVTLCGMAGAPGGLVEAGYAPCPTNFAAWVWSTTEIQVSGVSVRVLPGLSCRSADGIPEVMRGEETQVFGAMLLLPELAAGQHLVVLPGTHSKWVKLHNGAITDFRTYPTGELFALLAGQSTLTGPDTPGEGTFDEGLARGLARAGEPLTAALFEARAARMLDGRSKDWARGYISGLLIGGEVKTQANAGHSIVLIGDPTLCSLYEKSLEYMGGKAVRLDGDAAVIAGLKLARGGNA